MDNLDKIKKLLSSLTGNKHIILTCRGNEAIFLALSALKYQSTKKAVLIPDQGGWLNYPDIIRKLNLDLIHIPTEKGLINPETLKNHLDSNTLCLLYANPAGYFAEQPAKEIYNECKGKCSVVLDIPGTIGRKKYNRFADIQVCSFGRWKPLNLGHGGFMSTSDKKIFSIASKIKISGFNEEYAEMLLEKIKNLSKRYKNLDSICKKIKQDLKQFTILHSNKRGINVTVAFKTEDEKNKIISYCTKNSLEYTLCPRYIRVMEPAISIEVKRLD